MNIRKVISVLTELLDGILPKAYELIVVDDDSPDSTWKLAQELLPDQYCSDKPEKLMK